MRTHAVFLRNEDKTQVRIAFLRFCKLLASALPSLYDSVAVLGNAQHITAGIC